MMIPETSELYSYKNKVTNATWPRFRGSVVLKQPSNNAEDYQLKIVYRTYKRKNQIESNKKVNLVLVHGNGMNKGIWHYQVDKLFQLIPNLNYVVAPDLPNHGESTVLNKGRLGHELSWFDFAKDMVKITKIDESDEFLQPNVTNILLGHSMGGYISLVAAYLEPTLFDSIICYNPVAHIDEERYSLLNMAFHLWNDRKLIFDKFPAKDGDDYKDVIFKIYKKHGFFKRFDDTVLKNMVEDDFDSNQTPQNGFINTNTEISQEFFTYFAGTPSILRAYPIFKAISTPVYHIVGDNDVASEEAVEDLRKQLKKVLHPINIEGNHILHAEKPDYFIGIINDVINEIIENSKKMGDIRYEDLNYLKLHGVDYRDDLKKKAMEHGLAEKPFPKL